MQGLRLSSPRRWASLSATDRQFPGVVHGLRRQLAKLNEGDHLVHPAPDQLLVHACERHGTQVRQQPLAAMRLEVFSRAFGHVWPLLLEQSEPERLEGLARDLHFAALDRLHEATASSCRGSPAREPPTSRERPV